MTTTDTFTDAEGRVFIRGQEEEGLRVIGWAHRRPCPHYVVATVDIGRTMCDCDGVPLLGWRYQWPLDETTTVTVDPEGSSFTIGGGT